MIQIHTMLDVADNTGAKVAMCIRVLGKADATYAEIGDIIVAVVKKTLPGVDIKPGDIVRGVIVRTHNNIRRDDGTCVRFDTNSMVILDNENNPKGTRIFGAVARELRQKNFMKILSLATEVV